MEKDKLISLMKKNFAIESWDEFESHGSFFPVDDLLAHYQRMVEKCGLPKNQQLNKVHSLIAYSSIFHGDMETFRTQIKNFDKLIVSHIIHLPLAPKTVAKLMCKMNPESLCWKYNPQTHFPFVWCFPHMKTMDLFMEFLKHGKPYCPPIQKWYLNMLGVANLRNSSQEPFFLWPTNWTVYYEDVLSCLTVQLSNSEFVNMVTHSLATRDPWFYVVISNSRGKPLPLQPWLDELCELNHPFEKLDYIEKLTEATPPFRDRSHLCIMFKMCLEMEAFTHAQSILEKGELDPDVALYYMNQLEKTRPEETELIKTLA